ncbi:signal transduction histidine kinase [Phakopsora pachyrhizi]|uniref:Signal transduction histidine kinase n=1 Tax=Phakopsora pachyrhizi TaxID=170000 RepID=A0AAV0BRI3_PHAPC|nr:signal transduction histidine kinase [Phakopsora pachyrhizi]KAI8449684.1 signal transduction histidine kinase [Phakopsora pachyrhizi]CAH7688825.1 signal transduction histidine kinase [Phakopsora pachyrhizi]
MTQYPNFHSYTPNSSRSNQQLYSSRTPGEGYPFPRISRPLINRQTTGQSSTASTAESISSSSRISVNSSPQVVNQDVFMQLVDMEDENSDGKFKFTRGLIDLYFEDSEDTLRSMRESLRASDYYKLGRQAHFLRGSSASIGIAEVASICESIEMEVMSKKLPDFNWFNLKIEAINSTHILARQWFADFFQKFSG